jgi:hypothetical protein
MKKMFPFLVIGLISLSLLWTGCGKPPIDEPHGSNPPEITASVFPETVDYGGSANLSWNIINATSATRNGINIDLSDSLSLNNLVENDTSVFEATYINATSNEMKFDTAVVIIKVRPEVILAPSVTFTVSPPVQPIGGGSPTISWTSQNTDSVYINGVWYGPTGSVELGFISSDTTITYLAKGPGGEKTGTISLPVTPTPPPLTIDEMLNSGPWKTGKLEENYPTIDINLWIPVDIQGTCVDDNTLTFNLVPQTMVLNSGQNLCDGETIPILTYTWTRSDSTISGFGDRQLEKITLDTLIWTYESGAAIGDSVVLMIVRETFIH